MKKHVYRLYYCCLPGIYKHVYICVYWNQSWALLIIYSVNRMYMYIKHSSSWLSVQSNSGVRGAEHPGEKNINFLITVQAVLRQHGQKALLQILLQQILLRQTLLQQTLLGLMLLEGLPKWRIQSKKSCRGSTRWKLA